MHSDSGSGLRMHKRDARSRKHIRAIAVMTACHSILLHDRCGHTHLRLVDDRLPPSEGTVNESTAATCVA